MKTMGLVVTAVVAGALGAAAGYWLSGNEGKPVAPPTHPDAGKKAAEERARWADARSKEMEALREELAAATKKADVAETALTEARNSLEILKASAAKAPADPAAPAREKPAAPTRFLFAGYEEVLKEVDWDTIGTNMSAMLPLMAELGKSAREGGELNPESLGKIQQHNGPLLSAALKFRDRLPGSSVNSKFTHPVFMANAMAATLESAGIPLSATQAQSLEALGARYAARDASRERGYGDDTFTLEKIIDEAELRDGFFREAFALMTSQQSDTLSPPATRGVLGLDLYSSGLLWAQQVGPIKAADGESLRTQFESRIMTQIGIPAERRVDLQPLLEEWVDGVPSDWLEGDQVSFFGQNLMQASYVLGCAKNQLELQKRMMSALGLDDDGVKKLRGVPGVAVPVRP